jgi:predicted ester cyclase
MSLVKNKMIVRRFVEEVQSRHNLVLAEELMSPNMIDHYLESLGLPHSPNAVEDFKKFYSALLAAFPYSKATIQNQLAEGDLVATHKTLYGTHKGEFRGIQPTGKRIALDLMDIFRIAEGKIVEHWAVIDFMNLMRQLDTVRSTKQ